MKLNKGPKKGRKIPAVIEAEVVDGEPSTALVVQVDETGPDDPGSTALALCPSCAGPALLCGGAEVCAGSLPSDVDLRWLTAIRSLFAGLLLADTEAALW